MTEPNVKQVYICGLCDAHGFDEEFKEFHNNTPVKGYDFQSGDMFRSEGNQVFYIIAQKGIVLPGHVQTYDIIQCVRLITGMHYDLLKDKSLTNINLELVPSNLFVHFSRQFNTYPKYLHPNTNLRKGELKKL